jgi:hypothetical protein
MSIESMKLAFRVLERVSAVNDHYNILPPSLTDAVEETIDVLKEALAKQEQGEPDYKTLAIQLQQQRTWVGLTKGEVYDLYDSDYAVFYQRIEAKLRSKNERL